MSADLTGTFGQYKPECSFFVVLFLFLFFSKVIYLAAMVIHCT